MTLQKRIIFYVLCISLALLAALNLTSLYQRQNNTLFKSGQWRSLKTEAAYSVMAADAFFITRRALPYEQLDLGAWHGNHEIVSKKSFSAVKVEFKLFLKDDGYLGFQYNRNGESYDALIFSSNKMITSKYITATDSAGFVKNEELSPPLQINAWNDVKFEFGKLATAFYLNGKFIKALRPASTSQSFGVKGPPDSGTLVDNIFITLADGTTWIEDFQNSRNEKENFFKILTGIFSFVLIASYFLRNSKTMPYQLTLTLSILFLTALLFNKADEYYFAHYYLKADSPLSFLHKNIKDEMRLLSQRELRKEFIYRNLKANYFKKEYQKKYKILFLGSSQTWGMGARYEGDTISEKFKLYLNKKIPGQSFEVFNGAVSGQLTKDLFEQFSLFSENYPELVILNMSFNESRTEVFEDYLRRFIDLSRQKNFKLVLVPEAIFDIGQTNDWRLTSSRLKQNLVESLAKEQKLEYVLVHDYLQSKVNTGFLWWDVVHLSSYGQDLLARRLVNSLHRSIQVDMKKLRDHGRGSPRR